MGSLIGLLTDLWHSRISHKRQQVFEDRLSRDYLKLAGLEAELSCDWEKIENSPLLKIIGNEEGEACAAGQEGVQDPKRGCISG